MKLIIAWSIIGICLAIFFLAFAVLIIDGIIHYKKWIEEMAIFIAALLTVSALIWALFTITNQ